VSQTETHSKINFFSYIKGDKLIWSVAALLALFSFLPVYSASSNLAYLYGDGGTLGYLVSHAVYLVLGFGIIFGIHRIPYHYFQGISILMMPVIIGLLLYTLAQGTTIDGANASRWITIPIIDKTFQTSTLASVVLMVYVARYLSKLKDQKVKFKRTILPLWVPVGLVCGLILPANFSTAAILFMMVIILVFIGGYPTKFLGLVLLAGIVFLSCFVGLAKIAPDLFPNRVDTWISRVENFSDGKDTKADYQIEKAKIAIARGGITGVGIGKSVQRNFLPQSSSDFIYAIIVEEMGLIGAIGVMLAYLFILFRIVIIATKSGTVFGKLLVVAVGLPIIFQALINMGVAVELFPVTGQTLPLVSSGGSSIWMTCVALGIVLSVSVKREQEILKQEQEDRDAEKENNPLEVLSEAI
jgi:cell division protein FtsW